MADIAPDSSAPFAALLGHLIFLLRERPEEDRALQQTAELMAARLVREGIMIEAGIENSWALDGDPLKERLQLRQVDAIGIAAGTTVAELLGLARTLADNTAPIPSTTSIRVKLLPDPLPIQFSGPRASIPDTVTAVPRARQGDQLAGMVEGILRELQKAIARQQWLAVLHDAQAAVRAIPNLQEEGRRSYFIALKRQMTLTVMEALIEQGYRMAEERDRTAEVLRAGGFVVAERMLEILKQSDTIGPRAFLVDALGGMPEVAPLALTLLNSKRTAEVWLAAELLGRLQLPEAIPALVERADHPDERVRLTVIDALAHFHDKAVVSPLRRALGHPSSVTRARAGHALAARGSGAIAMPLLAALESEKDATTWDALLQALAGINASEATVALTQLALASRGRFGFGGKTQLKRQLAVVDALAAANTHAARQALDRIAAEGSGEVREQAIRARAITPV